MDKGPLGTLGALRGEDTRSLVRHLSMVAALVSVAVAAPRVAAQSAAELLTAPERTDYRETTRYADVVALMEATAERSPLIHLTHLGYTMEGRAIPLAVVGRVRDASPEAVREVGRTVAYLQGGIHSGEVEGKEVLLMFLREIAGGRHTELLDSLVILVGPVLNADGTERVQLINRPLQHGPVGGTGTRANAQGLNVNRDHMKLDSPEARSFARLLTLYDPHVAVDLHTTNGTRHAYHLTYSPPLHPNVHAGIIDIARDRIFPEMTAEAQRELGWDFYYYGNVQGQGEARGWYTFDYRALFNNNYLGLRNRIGLLSETYSYATLEDRITATRLFVDETLRFAYRHATEIQGLIADADAESLVGRRLAVRADFERSAEMVEILMGDVIEERNPYSGEVMLRRTEDRRPERMWEYGTFAPAATERVPSAYLVPSELTAVVDNLEDHGVRMETIPAAVTMQVERFQITSQTVAPNVFEGRIERTIEGMWAPAELEVPAGTVRVDVEQPLGRLVFSLLEPLSADGLATWGTLGEAMEGAATFPIWRVP